jgi:hypothetical protein
VGLIIAVTVESVYTDKHFTKIESIAATKIKDQTEFDRAILEQAQRIRERLEEFNGTWNAEWIANQRQWDSQKRRIENREARIKQLEENATDDQDWITLR